jgi:hypothetical protein
MSARARNDGERTMKTILLLTALTLTFALSAVSQGSPMPATATSLLTNQKPEIFRSAKGFSVNAGKSEWVLGESPSDMPSIETVYRSPESHKGVQPVLTVRVDELTHKTELKNYVKQWTKDYSTLGFSILNAKALTINSNPAYAMDVEETHGSKKLRQIVFLKDQKAVILTCRDLKESFKKTVKDCNEIFKSFEWNSSASESM